MTGLASEATAYPVLDDGQQARLRRYGALGRSVELARHGPGQFAGELNMLTGQRPFLTARGITGGTVLALTPAQVREVLARETDVADIPRSPTSESTPTRRTRPASSSPGLARPGVTCRW
jgi:Cyclic nucleotide-binding domain